MGQGSPYHFGRRGGELGTICSSIVTLGPLLPEGVSLPGFALCTLLGRSSHHDGRKRLSEQNQTSDVEPEAVVGGKDETSWFGLQLQGHHLADNGRTLSLTMWLACASPAANRDPS